MALVAASLAQITNATLRAAVQSKGHGRSGASSDESIGMQPDNSDEAEVEEAVAAVVAAATVVRLGWSNTMA